MTQKVICSSQDLQDGGKGVRFAIPDASKVGAGGTAPAFVIRYRGEVRAYLNRCGHIPVEIDWQPGEFFDHSGLYLICATHGALYAPESGRCIGGRCNGKGLHPLRVIEQDGQVFLIESDGEGGSGG
jgi:nitrite reductase/ring-hydroxylating ferredoxin subunit